MTPPKPFDPDTPPGRLAADSYQSDGPNIHLLRLMIGFHYIAGVGVIVLCAIGVTWLAAIAWPALQPRIPGSNMPILGWGDTLKAGIVGLVVGFLFALPFFSRAQMLSLYIRIEENTRLTKELLFYLLTKSNK